MSRQRGKNTSPERALRSALHALGLRYRIHQRPLPHLRREADIVFRKAKVAVYVDGCFWHGCPEHGTWPKRNAEFWREKIERNQERDRSTDSGLQDAGWTSLRVWEHEVPTEAAHRVAAALHGRA